MADVKIAPLFKLPKETVVELQGLQGRIDQSRKALAVMKEMGMDTTELDNQLNRSVKIRETLLKEFA